MSNERPQERRIQSFADINANYRDQWVVVALTKIENNVPIAGVVLSHVQEKENLDYSQVHKLRQRPGISPKFAIFRTGLDQEPS